MTAQDVALPATAPAATWDAAPPMIWVTDPDGGCTYLSEGWYAFTGTPPGAGLGHGWIDAIHPGDREPTRTAFAAANARHEAVRLDYRLRRHDGELRQVIDSAAPRFAPDGTFLGFVGSVLDVTDRMRAEEALREAEARFRALFTSIDEGYCLCEVVLDADGRPVDYRFLEANPHFASMTGLADPTGRTARELVPGLEDHWVETYARVAFGGESLRFEQGSEAMGRWFDVFATAVEPRGRFALVFKDVTERKRADGALQRSEAAQRRARLQAELLAEIASELEAADGPQARVRRLVDLLVPRVADVAAAVVAGADGAATATAPAGGGPTADALRALVEHDAAELPHDDATRSAALAAVGVRSHLALALDAGPDARGALLVGLTDAARGAYTDDDRMFAHKVAARLGALFTRARQRDEEHRVALRLQQALLPDAVVSPPGVDVAARYEAGGGLLEVGGDWYDTFTLPDGCLGLAVGDVVGHGLEAAAAMGRLRTALAALAPHAGGPGRLLSNLDAYATGAGAADFATACCGMLDPRTGVLRYASAGHPPMLAVAPDGTARWLEDGGSTPLFGRVDPDRPEASVTLAPGSLLVLYSDGLIERRREPLGVGLERLERAVRGARELPVAALCERVLDELGVAEGRDDDVVLLCLRLATTGAPRLHTTVPARPEELGALRAAVRAWSAEHGLGAGQTGDLLLALGEACTNAIEHAYVAGRPGTVGVELTLAADGSGDVEVRVADSGRWRPEVDSAGLRGRGTDVMRAVTSGFTRRTGADGTRVAFSVPAGPAGAA